MIVLKCEQCSGNNLVFKDGLYVCENCGARYIPENSAESVENLYIRARRSRDYDDGVNAIEYYEKILLLKPDDWEAEFFSVYFKCKDDMDDNKLDRAQVRLMKCITRTLEDIGKSDISASEKRDALEAIADKTVELMQAVYYKALVQLPGRAVCADFFDKVDREMIINTMESCPMTIDFLASCIPLHIKPVEPYIDIIIRLYENSAELREKLIPMMEKDEVKAQRVILAQTLDTIETYKEKLNNQKIT